MQKNKGQEWSNILLNEDSFNIPRGIPETFSSPPPSDMGRYYLQGLEGVSTKLNLRAASITNIASSYTGSTLPSIQLNRACVYHKHVVTAIACLHPLNF